MGRGLHVHSSVTWIYSVKLRWCTRLRSTLPWILACTRVWFAPFHRLRLRIWKPRAALSGDDGIYLPFCAAWLVDGPNLVVCGEGFSSGFPSRLGEPDLKLTSTGWCVFSLVSERSLLR